MDNKNRATIYEFISYLLSYPRELNAQKTSHYTDAIKIFADPENQSTRLILSFVEQLPTISPEYYVDLFELSPKCPLYLSEYAYQDDVEKRVFMCELKQDFQLEGFNLISGELPDFLPAVAEFLGLSILSQPMARRKKFIQKYLKPWLPKIEARLEKLNSPYSALLKALSILIQDEEAA